MAYHAFFPPVQGQFIFDEVDIPKPELSSAVEVPKKIFPLNQILYGVPGTVKTFLTTSYAAITTRLSANTINSATTAE